MENEYDKVITEMIKGLGESWWDGECKEALNFALKAIEERDALKKKVKEYEEWLEAYKEEK